ncbi:hypothetical protein QBC46DRAFT_363678 [Diplogelasinospora grovesii]|uniref:CBM-cenC domain-containing protein n=1 Tax=Diplogelasinospora grovesii TaxID=303347 RepID=A0AAN6N880_9PEZI|nr:hypothetical protein QBC46DRAFT_363678 [Diplogelasinospora grovesii]
MLSAMLNKGLLLAVGLLAAEASAACNANNCYRAMFPCGNAAQLSTASAFCATITAGGTTASNYPTKATAACGSDPSKYLSACACGPTCTPTATGSSASSTITLSSTTSSSSSSTSNACTATVTPNNLIANGDFECGQAPWTIEVPDRAAFAGLSDVGSNTGDNNFMVGLYSKPATPQLGVNARIISSTFPVTPGVNYRLSFYSEFSSTQAGFIGVMVNNNPIYTVDASDFGCCQYFPNFEFLFNTQITDGSMRIDTIALTRAPTAQ